MFLTLTQWLILLFFLSLALSLGLIALLRRFWQPEDSGRQVRVGGAYSPLLTWLKYGRVPRMLLRDWPTQPPAATPGPRVMAATPTVRQSTTITVESPPRAAALPKVSWRSLFSRSGVETTPSSVSLTRRDLLIEWSLIFVVILAFCSGFLDLSSTNDLPGNEADVFQSLDWTLYRSLHDFGQFPLWNPYIQTGLPYVADPMLHLYNPVVTAPVLLFGVKDGFKIALFLSFLLAALGMWWLGAVLKMGRVGRLWVALLYAMSGPPVARFFQGQYLFTLGYAWIPWTIAGLWLVTRTRRKVHVALTALPMALLFFSGNTYYAYYMLFGVGLFALTVLLDFKTQRPFVTLHLAPVLALLATGTLAFGLIAVQFFPLAEFWPRLSKAANLEQTDSQTVEQILLNYTVPDPQRPDALKFLRPEEFYAYIGWSPFIALLLLPLALWKRDKRPLLFFGLLLLFAIAWIDVRDMPWSDLFRRTYLLNQFRYPTRMLIYGALAIITLAGLGLDTAWNLLRPYRLQESQSVGGYLRWLVVTAASVVLGGLILWSVGDVFSTNARPTRTREHYAPAFEVMRWLRSYDLSDYYVRSGNDWHAAILSNGLRYLEAWYHFSDIRRDDDQVNTRGVFARPNYVVWSAAAPLQRPEWPDPLPVKNFETHTVYRLPHSLPLAFTASKSQLTDSSQPELKREDVTALTPFFPGPNDVEVIAPGNPDSLLVLMITRYPGWTVKVNGREQPLENVGGYMAVELQPGTHKYEFAFRPRSFFMGLLVSLLSLGVVVALAVIEWRAKLREAVARLRALSWPDVVARLREALPVWRWRSRWPRLVPVEAIYAGGVLKPDSPLALDDNSRVRLVVEAGAWPERWGAKLPLALRHWLAATTHLAAWLVSSLSLPGALFTLSLAVYVYTRLYALDLFPIYFFADEANIALLGETVFKNGFRDASGAWLPIYFEGAGLRWTPVLSVYFQGLALSLFGKSVFISRATSALTSVLAVLAVTFILRNIFKVRYWWAGGLILAVAPGWFLHSRTAFETATTTAFYGCFLLFYLLYREKSPRYLFPALVFGAATFYTYSNAQLVMAALAVGLFISDWRYHLRNWRTLVAGALFAVVLALPLIVFQRTHPEALGTHLRAVDSYWFHPIPLQDKIFTYLKNYGYGLSPQYWFFPNTHDLDRHRMDGLGQIHWSVLPFVLVGLIVCLAKLRSSRYRAVLIATLATPVGAAMLDIGIARVLPFVVPASLLAALGLEWLLDRLRRIPYDVLAVPLFVGLSIANILLLRTALTQGPFWSSDYGLYGMQFGAKQVFEDAIPELLESDPNLQMRVSSTWANGTDNFVRFFLTPEQWSHVQMLNVDYFTFEKRALDQNTMLVMTPNEYETARTSPKFKAVDVARIIPYPDGQPGFYFARLEYADNVDALFTAEREERRKPVGEAFELNGQVVTITHSRLDAGSLKELFDGDTFTLVRGLEANPLVFDVAFLAPQKIPSLQLTLGAMADFTLTLYVYPPGSDQPVKYEQQFVGLPDDPQVDFPLTRGPGDIIRLRMEIKNNLSGDTAQIHVREIVFR